MKAGIETFGYFFRMRLSQRNIAQAIYIVLY